MSRSTFLDMMGVPKVDLRTKPKCAICGIKVTTQNFASTSTHMEEGRWTPVKYYCQECYLKPEALSLKG